jgi:hypothetical protein
MNEQGRAPFPTRPKLHIKGLLRWAGLGAVVLYFITSWLWGAHRIGLHYDEAICAHGAVHMLHSVDPPPFAHDRGSWIRFAGRRGPLVILPYAGAIKDYVLLVPFGLFGPGAALSRLINTLLGALGIWGITVLLRREINAGAAAAVGFILALNPTYISHTVYDYGVVVVWMAILGFLAIAISYYKKRRTTWAAFLIGLMMGVGVWNRVNFIWFLGSALAAAIVSFRKRLLIPARHLAALACGGLIGVAPMLLFQILSGLAILGFINGNQSSVTLGSLLIERLQSLSVVLLIDSEMRGMWNGPPVPLWQTYFISFIVIFSLFSCLVLRRGDNENLIAWRRASALTFITFALAMMASRLNVSEHHLLMLLPVGSVVAALAFQALIARWKPVAAFAVVVALVYIGLTVYWNLAASRGLRESGGVNAWSDAIYSVNDYLLANYKEREIKILDWGLQNNLYVLSNARIKSTELFWGATRERSGSGVNWSEAISGGGVYLTDAGNNLHFPEATQGFWAALRASGQSYRMVEFHQKSGDDYAQLIDIQPLQKPAQ